MPLKLITLNIEGGKHLDKAISFLKRERPDVACLQEVFKADFPEIMKELGMEGDFFPNANKSEINEYVKTPRGIEGIAYLTRLAHSPVKAHYYVGKGTAPRFITPQGIDRVLVYSTVESKGIAYTVGTTHFSWTLGGKPDEQQREAFSSLMDFLKRFKEFVLMGDFNAPRGGEIFSEFNRYFKDNLPADVTSTLDPNLHRAKNLQLVVDTIFSTPGYTIENVRTAQGISDHKAVIGYLSRK